MVVLVVVDAVVLDTVVVVPVVDVPVDVVDVLVVVVDVADVVVLVVSVDVVEVCVVEVTVVVMISHTRSDVRLGAARSNSFGAQTVSAVQTRFPAVVQGELSKKLELHGLAQGEHTRGAVRVHSDATNEMP